MVDGRVANVGVTCKLIIHSNWRLEFFGTVARGEGAALFLSWNTVLKFHMTYCNDKNLSNIVVSSNVRLQYRQEHNRVV